MEVTIKPWRELSGPKGHLLTGNLQASKADPIGTLMQGWRQYGDMVAFNFGPLAWIK